MLGIFLIKLVNFIDKAELVTFSQTGFDKSFSILKSVNSTLKGATYPWEAVKVLVLLVSFWKGVCGEDLYEVTGSPFFA